MIASSPVGLHRVVSPAGRAAAGGRRARPARPASPPTRCECAVERLNLDAASYRQLREEHGDGEAVRAAVLGIVRTRGKMQNPVTGSGGMLIGIVDAVGPDSPLGLAVGAAGGDTGLPDADAAADHDGSGEWDGTSRAGARRAGTRSSSAARSPPSCPTTCPTPLALAALDVCGAPALVRGSAQRAPRPHVAVIGARRQVRLAGPRRRAPVRRVAHRRRRAARARSRAALGRRDSPTVVVVADARDPVALADSGRRAGRRDGRLRRRAGVRARRDPGHRATAAPSSSSRWPPRSAAAALGAEGLAADVTMLIGNGYVPGPRRAGARPGADRARRTRALRVADSAEHA